MAERTENENKQREELMSEIEGYTGTLFSLRWDQFSTPDMEKLLQALKTNRKKR